MASQAAPWGRGRETVSCYRGSMALASWISVSPGIFL